MSPTKEVLPGYVSPEQIKRLKNVCEIAYNQTIFYKREFDTLGINPSKITGLSDLKNFFLTREDFGNAEETRRRENGELIPFERTLITSGSSGSPLKRYVSNQEIGEFMQYMLSFLLQKNITPPQKVFLISPLASAGMQNVGGLLKYAGYTVDTADIASLKTKLDSLAEARAVYTFSPHVLYKALHQCKDELGQDYNIQLVWTTGDTVNQWMAAKIGEYLHVEPKNILNIYGGIEMDFLTRPCEFGEYHVIDDFIVELIPNSELGIKDPYNHIVVTCLKEFRLQPLIRYVSGDNGQFIECECGSPNALRVLGRTIDYSKHFDGRITPAIMCSEAYEKGCIDFVYKLFKRESEGPEELFDLYVLRAGSCDEEDIKQEILDILIHGKKGELPPSGPLKGYLVTDKVYDVTIHVVDELPGTNPYESAKSTPWR